MSDIPKGYMADSQGRMVPVETIRPEHLEEDRLVRELVGDAEALSGRLGAFRERALGDVAALKELVAERYDVSLGGRKGNTTLTSYDGRLQIQVAIGETLSFGPELQVAKELIDGCVGRWAEGSNAHLRALVEHAFQVNKVGKIDTARVLGLRRLEIDDAEWRRAMDAIGDAVRTSGSKTYFRAYRRDPRTEFKTAIPLDLANAEDKRDG